MPPHWFCLGAYRRALKVPWSLLPEKVRGVFLEADCKLDALNSTDLWGKRSLAVGESLLWTELSGVRFSAQDAAAVGLEATLKAFQEDVTKVQPWRDAKQRGSKSGSRGQAEGSIARGAGGEASASGGSHREESGCATTSIRSRT
jgi:hypothetical protein